MLLQAVVILAPRIANRTGVGGIEVDSRVITAEAMLQSAQVQKKKSSRCGLPNPGGCRNLGG